MYSFGEECSHCEEVIRSCWGEKDRLSRQFDVPAQTGVRLLDLYIDVERANRLAAKNDLPHFTIYPCVEGCDHWDADVVRPTRFDRAGQVIDI